MASPTPYPPARVYRLPGGGRNIGGGSRRIRRAPSAASIARRRILLRIAKLLLPLLALLLLASIAAWPQIQRQFDRARITYRRLGGEVENGRMKDAHYRGVDERGRPYAFTARTALQATPERVNLTEPKGDIVTESGSWVMLQSDQGVYLQHAGKLDLSGHVVLYREDGTTLRTATASVDLRQGAAASGDTVSAEGPFGTLDATGFALVDKGAVIQFSGPARMILNGHNR